MCLFNTEVAKAYVIEETHKNGRKTNTFQGFFLLPSVTKEWLPVAKLKCCDFYHRHLQSAYIFIPLNVNSLLFLASSGYVLSYSSCLTACFWLLSLPWRCSDFHGLCLSVLVPKTCLAMKSVLPPWRSSLCFLANNSVYISATCSSWSHNFLQTSVGHVFTSRH